MHVEMTYQVWTRKLKPCSFCLLQFHIETMSVNKTFAVQCTSNDALRCWQYIAVKYSASVIEMQPCETMTLRLVNSIWRRMSSVESCRHSYSALHYSVNTSLQRRHSIRSIAYVLTLSTRLLTNYPSAQAQWRTVGIQCHYNPEISKAALTLAAECCACLTVVKTNSWGVLSNCTRHPLRRRLMRVGPIKQDGYVRQYSLQNSVEQGVCSDWQSTEPSFIMML